MSALDDVIAKAKDMPIEELSILRSELETIIKDRAIKELERRQNELNELRVLAGMKRKPIKSAKPAAASAGKGKK